MRSEDVNRGEYREVARSTARLLFFRFLHYCQKMSESSGAGEGSGGRRRHWRAVLDCDTNLGLAVSLLAVVRFLGARYAVMNDCDEVFNYWEPVHFVAFGRGFQTWEYGSDYALRSYVYVLLFAIPSWIVSAVVGSSLWVAASLVSLVSVAAGGAGGLSLTLNLHGIIKPWIFYAVRLVCLTAPCLVSELTLIFAIRHLEFTWGLRWRTFRKLQQVRPTGGSQKGSDKGGEDGVASVEGAAVPPDMVGCLSTRFAFLLATSSGMFIGSGALLPSSSFLVAGNLVWACWIKQMAVVDFTALFEAVVSQARGHRGRQSQHRDFGDPFFDEHLLFGKSKAVGFVAKTRDRTWVAELLAGAAFSASQALGDSAQCVLSSCCGRSVFDADVSGDSGAQPDRTVSFFGGKVSLSMRDMQRKQLARAIWVSVVVTLISSWPFGAVMFAGFCVVCFVEQGATFCILHGVAAVGAVLAPMLAVDYVFFGRFLVAPWNTFAYNNPLAKKDVGAELYGTEPATYYIKNVLVNFNLLFPLATIGVVVVWGFAFARLFGSIRQRILSLRHASGDRAVTRDAKSMGAVAPATAVSRFLTAVGDWSGSEKESESNCEKSTELGSPKQVGQQVGKPRRQEVGKRGLTRSAFLEDLVRHRAFLHLSFPLVVWISLLSLLPHKEERFLYTVYPLLVLMATVGYVFVFRSWRR